MIPLTEDRKLTLKCLADQMLKKQIKVTSMHCVTLGLVKMKANIEQGIQTSVSIKQTERFTNTGLTGIRGMKMKKQEWNSILMMCLSIHQKNIFQPMPADYGLDYGFRTAGLERQILKLLILKSIL